MIKNTLYFVLFIIILSSCKTQQATLYNPKEVALLSQKLSTPLSNIDKNDDKNMPLYAEVSLWLGIPYRYGGISKAGLDCSGFVNLIYDKVYNVKLPRSTKDLSKMSLHKQSANSLKTGDLVFFATTNDKKKITHVGIYLKNGSFIHASTSRGVIVSNLNEGYYSKSFIRGGRLK